MKIESDKSLHSLNSFAIDVSSKLFAEVTSEEGIQEIISDQKLNSEKKFILGGGSNILFTKNFDGLVIRNSLKGMQILKEDVYHVWIKVAAGEVWHDFVMYCVGKNLAGV